MAEEELSPEMEASARAEVKKLVALYGINVISDMVDDEIDAMTEDLETAETPTFQHEEEPVKRKRGADTGGDEEDTDNKLDKLENTVES